MLIQSTTLNQTKSECCRTIWYGLVQSGLMDSPIGLKILISFDLIIILHDPSSTFIPKKLE